MNGNDSPESRGALFGVFLFAFGIVTLLSVGGIHQMALGGNADPGPRALPQVLAGCLIFGGAAQVIAYFVRRRRATAATTSPDVPVASGEGPNLLDAGILLGALILYIAALSWIGFTLSTLAFSIGMMWRLQIRWVLNLIVSVCLVAAVYVLFVMVFRVQLPAGMLGLPF